MTIASLNITLSMALQIIKLISELVGALANLLWPIVVLIIALKFRPEIRIFINRLKKGKLLGQEVELDLTLNSFAKLLRKLSRKLCNPILNFTL